jgi:Ser/Thr protein kinase RdoA (MazF antagonist)
MAGSVHRLIQSDILLKAYAEFEHRDLALIKPLRAMRIVYYLAWIARR